MLKWIATYRKEKRWKLIANAVKNAITLTGDPPVTIISFSKKLSPALESDLRQYWRDSVFEVPPPPEGKVMQCFVSHRPLPSAECFVDAIKASVVKRRTSTAEDFLKLADLNKDGSPQFHAKTRLEECVMKIAKILNTYSAFTHDEVKKPQTWHTFLSDGCGGFLPATVKLSITPIHYPQTRHSDKTKRKSGTDRFKSRVPCKDV